MFIDETVIEVKAGDGGNGCFAHDRQKFKPRGKPSGGNGGRGGHVFIEVSKQVHTLQDVSYHKKYNAERGAHGKGSNKHGHSGESVVIKVPRGTIIINDETGDIIKDCLTDGERFIIAKGGRGGKGNAALVGKYNRNPEYSEPGKEGEHYKLRLTLKVLADVGLVGRPNAGKSTFLTKISKAHPKIADYPFTTTRPHLGIVKPEGSWESFVVADIPGLIEGSHTGKGLGIRFLKHIERTKVLAFMIESTSEDIIKEANTLMKEIEKYSELLAKKPKCFIVTKSDLLAGLGNKNIPKDWLQLSSVTGDGINNVVQKFKTLLDEDSENNPKEN